MSIICLLTDFCDIGRIVGLCRQKNEPIVLAQNGSDQMVVMSKEIYEKQLGLLGIYRKLSAAEKQLEEGIPLLEGKEVFRRLRVKHGR